MKEEITYEELQVFAKHFPFHVLLQALITAKFGSLLNFEKETGIHRTNIYKWGTLSNFPGTINRNKLKKSISVDLFTEEVLLLFFKEDFLKKLY